MHRLVIIELLKSWQCFVDGDKSIACFHTDTQGLSVMVIQEDCAKCPYQT